MANIYLLVINVFSKNDKRSKIQQTSSCNCVLRSTAQIPTWISVQWANQNNGAVLPDIIPRSAGTLHGHKNFRPHCAPFAWKITMTMHCLALCWNSRQLWTKKVGKKKTCKKIYCFSVRFTISIGSSYKKTPTTTIWESRFLSTILM